MKLLDEVKSDSVAYHTKKALKSNFEFKNKEIDKVFELLIKSENSNVNRENISKIALEYYKINNLIKLKEASSNLLKRSVESRDSSHLATAYRYLGSYYKFNFVNDSSFYYYLKAEKIYSKQNDLINLANILFNKGIVQYFASDYLGAELSLTRSYSIYKNTNEYDKLFGTLNQLGLVYNELKEYDKAVFYHNKALETVKKLGLQSKEHQESVCYNNLGYLFLKQKKYNSAIINFQLGLKDYDVEKDNPELFANLTDNLAYCKLKSNISSELPNLFIKALEVRKRLDNITPMIGSYIHLSEYYQIRGNNLRSIEYSKKAIEVAKKSKNPLYIILALKQSSIVDKENASKYTSEYIKINDSLQIEERKSKDRFARIELETEEIRQERNDFEEKSQVNLYYLFGTITFFTGLILVRTQRTRNRELILRQAQQKANEDIYKLIISQQEKIEEGRAQEKNRIAKELHDGVLGRLFGLRLNLDGLNSRTDDDSVKLRLDYLNELKNIEQDIREISHELSREKMVLINNFVAIINNLLDEQTKINLATLKSRFANDIDWDLLSNLTKINLYRILQESLQNINKHAEAKNIKVILIKDKKGNLVMSIVDDGKGFEIDRKSNGIGMQNMFSRTHECKGIIDIKSEKNKGTKITITVPLEHKTIVT